MRCEGYKKPGAFVMGCDPSWKQCKEEGIVMLTVVQEEEQILPACKECWEIAIERNLTITNVAPIKEEL